MQPAAEMSRLEALERLMGLLNVAAVALVAQHEAAPERAHFRQMVVPPAFEDGVEYGPEQWIGTDAVVKGINQLANVRFRGFTMAGEARRSARIAGIARMSRGRHRNAVSHVVYGPLPMDNAPMIRVQSKLSYRNAPSAQAMMIPARLMHVMVAPPVVQPFAQCGFAEGRHSSPSFAPCFNRAVARR